MRINGQIIPKEIFSITLNQSKYELLNLSMKSYEEICENRYKIFFQNLSKLQ